MSITKFSAFSQAPSGSFLIGATDMFVSFGLKPALVVVDVCVVVVSFATPCQVSEHQHNRYTPPPALTIGVSQDALPPLASNELINLPLGNRGS
jgi:hypothetical protein